MYNTYFYLDVKPYMVDKKIIKMIKVFDIKNGQIMEREVELNIILSKNILEKDIVFPNKGFNLEKDLVVKFNVLN